MAKLSVNEIKQLGMKLLEANPEGIRWMELLRGVEALHPETPHNTIHGSLHSLLKKEVRVRKIAKGLYRLVESDAQGEPGSVGISSRTSVDGVKESDFYQSFADYLKDELEEANRVVAVGGNSFRGKWGTPDVLGVLKPEAGDLIKFAPQIVSAEIKIDINVPVVAFGQAVAYRLFSNKSYMVMPNTTARDDISRLDALAAIYGVGLVTFTPDPKSPDYSLRVRALSSEPDMFYVNEMARRLHQATPEAFNELF